MKFAKFLRTPSFHRTPPVAASTNGIKWCKSDVTDSCSFLTKQTKVVCGYSRNMTVFVIKKSWYGTSKEFQEYN